MKNNKWIAALVAGAVSLSILWGTGEGSVLVEGKAAVLGGPSQGEASVPSSGSSAGSAHGTQAKQPTILAAQATVANYEELAAAVENPSVHVIKIAGSILLDSAIAVTHSVEFVAEDEISLTSADGQRHFNVSGGSVLLRFTNVTLDGNHHQGGIDNTAEHLVVTGGNFINCAKNANGGAIASAGDLKIVSSTFMGNSATGTGGAVYLSGEERSLSVIGSHFENNEAASGGALGGKGILWVEDSTLQDNRASAHGGGIAVEGAVSMSNSLVAGNMAGQSGGGILAAEVRLFSSEINGNTAALNGGGVSAANKLELLDTKVLGNRAQSGGGLYGGKSTALTNSLLEKNAGYNGGGIRIEGEGKKNLFIKNSQILNNSAESTGGGISVKQTLLTMDNSRIAGNIAEYGGGGILAETASDLLLTGSELAQNSASVNHLTDKTYGGGGAHLISSSLALIDCNVSENLSC